MCSSDLATGRLAAADMIRIVACGLRGAGRDVTDAEVAAMRVDGGVVGWAALVADLLAVTFGGDEPAPATPSAPRPEGAADRPPADVPGP